MCKETGSKARGRTEPADVRTDVPRMAADVMTTVYGESRSGIFLTRDPWPFFVSYSVVYCFCEGWNAGRLTRRVRGARSGR